MAMKMKMKMNLNKIRIISSSSYMRDMWIAKWKFCWHWLSLIILKNHRHPPPILDRHRWSYTEIGFSIYWMTELSIEIGLARSWIANETKRRASTMCGMDEAKWHTKEQQTRKRKKEKEEKNQMKQTKWSSKSQPKLKQIVPHTHTHSMVELNENQ